MAADDNRHGPTDNDRHGWGKVAPNVDRWPFYWPVRERSSVTPGNTSLRNEQHHSLTTVDPNERSRLLPGNLFVNVSLTLEEQQ